VTAGIAARFCYGAAIVVVLLVEPGGLAALARRARLRPAGRTRRPAVRPAGVDIGDTVDIGEDVAPATPGP
jgi:branched-chain amino acid transport system permease protein